MSKPITQNDLGGSKMIFNFLDSAFSIGISAKDSNIRFIKQVKVRSSDFKYNESNVMLWEIEKKDSFLQFVTVGYDEESEHLKKRKDNDKQQIIADIKLMQAEGKSIRQIAKELGMSHATVARWAKKWGVSTVSFSKKWDMRHLSSKGLPLLLRVNRNKYLEKD